MPRKLRHPKERFEEISEVELHFLSDGLLGTAPEEHSWETFKIKNDFMHGEAMLWDENKAEILQAWIRERPGTRPRLWWEYDAPRITSESAALLGRGSDIGSRPDDFCEPRRRLGGVGNPKFEHLNYGPSFHLGIPDSWITQDECDMYNGRLRHVVTGEPITCDGKWTEGHFKGVAINPSDLPKFESQPAYLRRHDLLMPEEERRLKAKDYEPETVEVFEEGDEETEANNANQWPADSGQIQ